MICVCFLNSISTFHQYIQSIQGQRIMPVIVSANTEPSVRHITPRAVCFLCTQSTSAALEAFDFSLIKYCAKEIQSVKRSLCYRLTWACCGFEFKHCDTNMQVTITGSTAKLHLRLWLTWSTGMLVGWSPPLLLLSSLALLYTCHSCLTQDAKPHIAPEGVSVWVIPATDKQVKCMNLSVNELMLLCAVKCLAAGLVKAPYKYSLPADHCYTSVTILSSWSSRSVHLIYLPGTFFAI